MNGNGHGGGERNRLDISSSLRDAAPWGNVSWDVQTRGSNGTGPPLPPSLPPEEVNGHPRGPVVAVVGPPSPIRNPMYAPPPPPPPEGGIVLGPALLPSWAPAMAPAMEPSRGVIIEPPPRRSREGRGNQPTTPPSAATRLSRPSPPPRGLLPPPDDFIPAPTADLE